MLAAVSSRLAELDFAMQNDKKAFATAVSSRLAELDFALQNDKKAFAKSRQNNRIECTISTKKHYT